MSWLRGAVAYIGFAAVTAVLGTLAMVASLLTLGKNHGTRLIPKLWARLVLACCGVRYEVSGLENFDPRQPFIFASNHQSLLDPPLLMAAAPQKVRFISKRSLFYVPILGQAMWAAGNVPIDRGRTERSTRKLRQVGKKVGGDLSILFFPEGTRSEDGGLLPLKRGAAVMALQTGLPLLPVAVAGTGELLPKGAGVAKKGTVGVAFGAPIPIGSRGLQDREAVTAELRIALERLLPQAEALRARPSGS